MNKDENKIWQKKTTKIAAFGRHKSALIRSNLYQVKYSLHDLLYKQSLTRRDRVVYGI